MTWVRRQPPRHRCTPPVLDDPYPLARAVGNIGDLWRCDACPKLWRVADASEGQRGRITLGTKWMPATLGQRLRHWGQGRHPVDGYQPTGDIEGDPPRQTGTDWLYSVEEKRA